MLTRLTRLTRRVVLGTVCVLGGCASVGIGLSLPLPGVGSVGVGVDSSGRVGGGVAVGTGGVSVGVGASGRLPPPAPKASEPTR